MSSEDQNLREALDGIDQEKRETLTKLGVGTTFATPVVLSYVMQGLSVTAAYAGSSSLVPNQTKSDVRLKTDVVRIGTHPAGFGIYRFKYLWSDVRYSGVLAHEILESTPSAVTVGADGYLEVDYDALGVEFKALN